MDELVRVVQELSLARDMDTVMRIVRKAARTLTGADGATFVLRDNGMCFYADEDAIAPLWKGLRFPMSACISGWSMINRKPAVIEDIYSDERIPVEAYRPTFVKSLAMVPIRTVDPIGAIGNYWAKRHLPTQEEVKILQSLADITAITIENVRIYSDLKETIEDLDTFIYKASHSMLGPIASIRGLTGLAADAADVDSARHYNQMVSGQADHMNSLLKKLILTMGIRSREKVIEPIHFKKLIDNITGSPVLEKMCEGIDIQVEVQATNFHSDPFIIDILLHNLVDNAARYSRKNAGGAFIRIGVKQHKEAATITVADNGIGIPENLQKDIFKMFYRATDKEGGSGLGLYMVMQCIKKLGGHIDIESREMEGTTFKIHLLDQT